MKKTFKKIWYIVSAVFIISGMILVLPGAIYGGNSDNSENSSSQSSIIESSISESSTPTSTTIVDNSSSSTESTIETSSTDTYTTETTEAAVTTASAASVDTTTTTTVPVDTTTTTVPSTTTVDLTNADIQDKGSVSITLKSDDTSLAVNFYLKSVDGKYFASNGITVSKEDKLAKQTITPNNTLIWSGLSWGNYKIEMDSISGYVSTITPDTFTIDAKNKKQLVTVNISAVPTTTQESADTTTTANDNNINDNTTTTETTTPVDTTTTTIDEGSTTTEVTQLDTTPPVIVLNGDAVINLKIGDTFTDPGATAVDDKDGEVAVTATGTVDTNKVGSYIISYNASDSAGNAAAIVTRTVNVAELPDTTPPVIVLNGDAVINLKIGDTFTDPGATATDNKDESVTVTATGTVNTNFASSYIISYNAKDSAGNNAVTVTRTVNVTSIATVSTNKPDYIPNDYVLVTGSGWLPGETVKLDFHETLIDMFQQTTTYYTVADSEGNIRDLQYLIELRHLGASFVLTATGLTSGLTAQTTFTDTGTPTSYYLYVTYNQGDGTVTQGFQSSENNSGSAIHFDVYRSGGIVTAAVVKDGSGNIVATWTGNGSEYNNLGDALEAYWHWIWNGNVLTISHSNTVTPNYGSVTIIKKVDGNTPSSGSFSFYYTIDGGAHIPFTLSAANNWTITLSVIIGRSYVIVEDDPGSNWSLPTITKISGDITFNIDESTRSVSFTPNCNGTIVYNNHLQQRGSIEVTKTGLEGTDQANLTLKDSNGNTISPSPQKVSNNGKASWTNLPFGTYTVVEDFNGITNTYTYSVTNPVATIVVDKTDKTSVTITNSSQRGSIEVTKTGLEGTDQANLTLKDSNGNTISPSPQKVSNNGKASWTNLPFGTYTVVEDFNGITNTYTYSVTNPVATIVVDKTDKTSVTITNSSQRGSIHITKSLIGGLTGGIYTFSITANDTGSTWTHPDVTINLDDTDTTNDSVLITDIPLGSYTVTENIPTGAIYHVTIPTGGIYTANLTTSNPDVTAAFTNEANTYSVSVQKATVGTGFTGSFIFELQRVDLVNGVTNYTTISTLTISSAGGTASFPVNTNNPITAGTYRVVETGRGAATYTDVSNLGIPAATTVVNTISPTFVLNESNTSQTVYFVNYNPGTPPTGSIMIVKNITVAQGTNTTFTFTITPAINGVSSYNVVVPANQNTGTFTINNVPFNVTYTISENSLPGWFLQSSEGLTFTLNAAAALATPVFTNTPVGGGTTTTTGITVAGLTTTPGIQVLGIQEMPFTGSRDTLFKIGMLFIILGLMMMILLPVILRTGKHQLAG
ncbi:MAG: DUF5011 domain-containing protein [Cyanobacteria bacterium]|nr:DUF5011 domain-containing protein [Cyanobacteriota bacterium]